MSGSWPTPGVPRFSLMRTLFLQWARQASLPDVPGQCPNVQVPVKPLVCQSKSQGQARSPGERETHVVLLLGGMTLWVITLTNHSSSSATNGSHPSHTRDALTPPDALESCPTWPYARSAGFRAVNQASCAQASQVQFLTWLLLTQGLAN